MRQCCKKALEENARYRKEVRVLIERIGEHCDRRDGVCHHDSGAVFWLPCPIERLLKGVREDGK